MWSMFGKTWHQLSTHPYQFTSYSNTYLFIKKIAPIKHGIVTLISSRQKNSQFRNCFKSCQTIHVYIPKQWPSTSTNSLSTLANFDFFNESFQISEVDFVKFFSPLHKQATMTLAFVKNYSPNLEILNYAEYHKYWSPNFNQCYFVTIV